MATAVPSCTSDGEANVRTGTLYLREEELTHNAKQLVLLVQKVLCSAWFEAVGLWHRVEGPKGGVCGSMLWDYGNCKRPEGKVWWA